MAAGIYSGIRCDAFCQLLSVLFIGLCVLAAVLGCFRHMGSGRD